MKKILIVSVLALCCGIARGAVTVEIGKMTLPTYPYGDPDPVATADPGLYPYFRYDGQSAVSRPQAWETVVLSNGRIAVTMVPAIGGKVWRARDLVTGRDFIYANDAVKFRDIALRGPWCSGGIEFNFGITGHAPWTTAPVDWTTRKNPDGSASYFCGGFEFVTRTFWQVEVALRPDADFFTTRFTWHNGGGAPCTRYQWSNSAVSARGNPEMVYPGTHQIGHEGSAHPWPRDAKGVDRSRYANDADLEAVSWHVMNGDNRFFGAWWEGLKFGMWHRNASEDKFGRKIFMWSQARSGGIWEDLLTDKAGQYIELQSGRGLQQQQPGCERTPFKYQTLVPGATDVFEEQWGCARDRAVYDAAKAFPSGEIARPTAFPKDYDTNSVYALYRNGEQKMRAGLNVAGAAKLLEKALAKDPCFVPALGELAAFELRRGNVAKAESLAEKALAVDTYDGPANFISGEIALDANRLARARERFAVASLDAAYRPAALVRLGMVAIRERDYATAAACARKAIECSAFDPEAHQLAAVAARLDGDPGGHFNAAEKGLARTPLHYGLRYEDGDKPETLAKGELPDPTLVEVGLWYAKAGLDGDAKRIWATAPNDPIAKLLAGDVAGAAALPVELVYPHGRETIAALERATQANPSWKFKYYLAIAIAPFGDSERCKALLESCGDAPDAAVFYLVRAARRKGAAAIADLKRAAALGDSWRVGRAFVKAYLKDGKTDEAIAAAQDYRTRYPGLQQLDSAAVDAFVAAKRYAEAIAVLEKMHVLPSEFNKAIPRQWNLCHRELAKEALQKGGPTAASAARHHRDAVLSFPENLGAGRPVDPVSVLKDWPAIEDRPTATLHPIFRDGMVFAAGKPLLVYGSGTGSVKVTFRGETRTAEGGAEGWRVTFPPAEPRGAETLSVELDGKRTELKDVRVGEVFLVAGQSNVRFTLGESTTDRSAWTDDPLLRCYTLPQPERTPFLPSDGWVPFATARAKDWSALIALFGRERRAAGASAFGAVGCYQGASVIESWIPAETAAKRVVAKEKLHGDHTHPKYGRWNAPGQLYRDTFRAIGPFSFTGVVWYQGESNTGSPEEAKAYEGWLGDLVATWRRDLGDESLRFLVVQIADFAPRNDANWRAIQTAQVAAADRLKGVAVVRSADVCESCTIHPRDKSRLARRLSQSWNVPTPVRRGAGRHRLPPGPPPKGAR